MRAFDDQRDAVERRRPPAPVPAPLSPAGVLALQRSAGNAATGRMLGTPASPMLQRLLFIEGQGPPRTRADLDLEDRDRSNQVRGFLPADRRDDATLARVKAKLTEWAEDHTEGRRFRTWESLEAAVGGALSELDDNSLHPNVVDGAEVTRPPVEAGTLMKDILDLAIAAGIIDRNYRFDFSRFSADTEGRAVATQDELRLSFCLENQPPRRKGDTSNNTPGDAEDPENFTSCHQFAVTLLELLGKDDDDIDLAVPADLPAGGTGVQVGLWAAGVASTVRAQAESGAAFVFRIHYGIHSFTLVTRSGHVEVLQSFAGWSGFGAGMGMAAGLVFTPARFAELFSRALGAARSKADKERAAAACTELFGGGIREGFPAVLAECEYRPLREHGEIIDALRDRLVRNLAVFEALRKGASTGPSKKARKE